VATFVTVRTFDTPQEAMVARGYLEANGVAAYLPDWHVATNAWYLVHALHGIRLDVHVDDADVARALLDETSEAPQPPRGRMSPLSLLFAGIALFLAGLPHRIRRR
jgi:hypothetical protein